MTEKKNYYDSNCVFCRIAGGHEIAYIVRVTEYSMAFLDKRPITEGHTLVIPRKHRKNIEELNKEEMLDLFKLIVEIGKSIKKYLEKKKSEEGFSGKKDYGYNVVSNVEEAAGQTVFHCHFHVVPRSKGDKINVGTEYVPRKELTNAFKIASDIINELQKLPSP